MTSPSSCLPSYSTHSMSQRELRSKKPVASVPTKAVASKQSPTKSTKRGTAANTASSKHGEPAAKSPAGSSSPPAEGAPLSYRQMLQTVKAALQASSPHLKPRELDSMARAAVAAQKKQEQAEKDRLESTSSAEIIIACVHTDTLSCSYTSQKRGYDRGGGRQRTGCEHGRR